MMKNLFSMSVLMILFFSLAAGAFAQKPEREMEDREKPDKESMEKIHSYMQMGDAYRRLSKIAAGKEDYAKALEYLNELLPLFDKVTPLIKNEEKKKGVEFEKSEVQMQIAELYLKSGQEEKAKNYIEDLLKGGKVSDRALPSVYLRLSRYYEKNNDLKKAEEMLLKSLELNKKLLK